MRGDEIHLSAAEGDIHLALRRRPAAEERAHARRRRFPRPLQALPSLAHDALQRRQRAEHGFVLRVRRLLRREELLVQDAEQRDEVGRLREVLDERLVVLHLLRQLHEVGLRHEEQRLGAHQLEVALVENIREQVRLRLEFRAEPLDELPVLVLPIALDDDHEVVLAGELLLKLEEVLVILLVRADEVVAAGAELQPVERVEQADHEQQHLRIEERARVQIHRVRQPGEEALDEGGLVS